MLKDDIFDLLNKIDAEEIKDKDDLINFKKVSKNQVDSVVSQLKKLNAAEKKEVGPLVNRLREKIDAKYKATIEKLNTKEEKKSSIDYSLPVESFLGNKHPLTLIRNKLIKILKNIGFNIIDTCEIEDDWHNFTALNVPKDHPARDMQDTFFIDNLCTLLRTHTTSSQIRIIERKQPPIKSVSIGRVYRNETISSRSNCYFHQIDAFYIDKNINMLDLKFVFRNIICNLFGNETRIRIRPSYFPFTSPSVEMDVECFLCKSSGCSLCKNSGWLEVFGGGLIHENVLKNCNINSEEYSGIALGGGLERLTLLVYRIKDIRLFTQNDIRFLKQFIYC